MTTPMKKDQMPEIWRFVHQLSCMKQEEKKICLFSFDVRKKVQSRYLGC